MGKPAIRDDDHFRKLERMYHAAPVNAFYAPRLAVSEGRAVLEMEVLRELSASTYRKNAAVIWVYARSDAEGGVVGMPEEALLPCSK